MWIVCVLVCLECMKLKTSSAITRHKQTLIHPETSTRHLTPFSWFLFALPSALHSPGLVVAAGSAIESIVNPKEVGLGHCRLVLVRQCPWKKQCWKWCHPNLRILIYIVLTSFSEQCFTFSFFCVIDPTWSLQYYTPSISKNNFKRWASKKTILSSWAAWQAPKKWHPSQAL